MRAKLSALLKDPLLHFVVLGGLIFLVYELRHPSADLRGRESPITINRADIEQLRLGFTRSWLRPPSSAELAELVEERVREEIYVREALFLGLGEDDVVVRRRLRQKLEFVSQDTSVDAEPKDEELAALLASEPEQFRSPMRISFVHVYFDPAKHGKNLPERIASTLTGLAEGKLTYESVGDPFLLPQDFYNIDVNELRKQWGMEFVQALEQAPLGSWHGPLASPYGKHGVLVQERTPGRVPTFDQARTQLREVWMERARRQANDAYYQSLRARHIVQVEPWP